MATGASPPARAPADQDRPLRDIGAATCAAGPASRAHCSPRRVDCGDEPGEWHRARTFPTPPDWVARIQAQPDEKTRRSEGAADRFGRASRHHEAEYRLEGEDWRHRHVAYEFRARPARAFGAPQSRYGPAEAAD